MEKSKKISSNGCLGNLSLMNLKFGNVVNKKVYRKTKSVSWRCGELNGRFELKSLARFNPQFK